MNFAMNVGMKPNIKHQSGKPVLNRWVAVLAAFLVVGIFSPFGMKALNHLNVQAPWSDIVLSTVMFLMMLAIYRLLRRSASRTGLTGGGRV